MNRNNSWITLLGFLLAGTGMLALVLSLVGVQLSFLTWIDMAGPLPGFVIRLLMVVGGIVIIYLTQTNFQGENGDA